MSWFSAVEPTGDDSQGNGGSPGTGANATLSPELFAKIKAIQIRTQRIVNAVFAGE